LRGKKIKKRIKDIALITGRIGSSFNAAVIRGAEEAVKRIKPVKYKISYYAPTEYTRKAIGEVIASVVRNKNSDAVIIMGGTAEKGVLMNLKQCRLPAVFVERKADGFNSVRIDNYKCGKMAAEHFIKSGRIKTAVILDPQSGDAGSAANERYCGFRDRMNAEPENPPKIITTAVKTHTIDHGRMAFDRIEAGIRGIDSVFSVAGDFAAIGFMMEAMAHGYRIPKDFAILGFDDIEMASVVSPALSTIKQPIPEMGKEAVKILDGILRKKTVNLKDRVLKSSLIIRESA